MKRFFALLMAVVMVFCLAACTGSNKPTETEAPTDPEPTTPAGILLAAFKADMANGTTDLEELANKLISNEIIPFSPATMPVEPGYLNGFTNEIQGFAQGVTFGPMIGSIPFVGYLFQLEEGADVDAFLQTLKDNADLRWNICTSADEMICDHVGQTVFFVMAPASFQQ